MIRRLLCRFGFHRWVYDREANEAWEYGYVTWEKCSRCSAKRSEMGDLV